jgi:hypothetical protein
MANWFHWNKDLEFYRTLCTSDSVSPDTHTTSSPLSDNFIFRRQPLTISYFYEISPRLNQIKNSLPSDDTMEKKILYYFSFRPVSRLRQVLAEEFIIPTKNELKSIAPNSIESTTNGEDDDTLIKGLISLSSSAVSYSESTPSYSSSSGMSTRSRRGDNGSQPTQLSMQQLAISSETEKEEQLSGEELSDEIDDSTTSAVQLAHRKRARSLPRHSHSSSTKKGKVSTSVAPSPPPSLPIIPCLLSPNCVPIEIVSLGLSTWSRIRKSSKENPQHRQAMDEALLDLVWELADHLDDGPKLEIREYKQAKRNESRTAAAKYFNQMLPERGCTLLQSILVKMLECNKETKTDC